MSEYSSVVWSQGLFLKPEHFQQQERYAKYQIQGSLFGRQPFSWGVTRLEIQDPAISRGKIALKRVSGIMPDGLFFDSDVECCLPDSVTVAQGSTLFLAINRSRIDSVEISHVQPYTRRFKTDVSSARDNSLGLGSETVAPEDTVDVAVPNLMLVSSSDSISDLDAIAVARVADIDADGVVILDRQFIPVCLSIRCSDYILQFTAHTLATLETMDLRLEEKLASAQAEVLVANTLNGAFSVLMCVRTYRQKFRHVDSMPFFHPVDFYALAADMLAELSCFAQWSFPIEDIVGYDHLDPTFGFIKLCTAIDRVLLHLLDNLDEFSGQGIVMPDIEIAENLLQEELPSTPAQTPSVPPW